jgi:hypothetical protein
MGQSREATFEVRRSLPDSERPAAWRSRRRVTYDPHECQGIGEMNFWYSVAATRHRLVQGRSRLMNNRNALDCGQLVDNLYRKLRRDPQVRLPFQLRLVAPPDSVDIDVDHFPASAANVAGMVRALPLGRAPLFVSTMRRNGILPSGWNFVR